MAKASQKETIANVNLHDIHTIVFDAVGTVIDASPSPAEVYFQVAKRLGSNLSLSDIHSDLGAAISNHFGPIENATPLVRPETSELQERNRWRDIVFDTLGDLNAHKKKEAFETLWSQFGISEAWSVFSDVDATFRGLQTAGFGVSIASNFDMRLHSVLDHFTEFNDIKDTFTSSQIGYSKPDPRFFETVASRLDVLPANLLMVGDSQTNDVLGAKAAGWKAILVDRSRPTSDTSVNSLTNLLH